MTRAFVVLAAATVAAGALIAVVDLTVTLVAVLAGLVTAPLIVRAVGHRFDVFEPIVWANAALFVMFVVHPIAHWAYGSYTFRGLDIEGALGGGLAVAVAGTAAIQLGYSSGVARAIAGRLPSASTELHDTRAASAYSLGLLALGTAGYIAFPEVGMAASAYLYYLPMLAIPGALLLLAIGLRAGDATSLLVGILAVAVGFVILGPSGQRAWLLVLLAPVVVYGVYLRREARPGVLPILIATLIAIPFLTAARDLTPGQSLGDLVGALGHATGDTPQAVRDLVLGPDTEMLDGLALEVQVVPRDLPYHPGNSLTSLIAQPIPRALWPDKPRQAEELLNEWFFGSVGYVAGSPGVAFSIFGGLYFDDGLISVLLGGLACGVLVRISWEWYRKQTGSLIAGLQLAAAMPFTVILMRGNIADTLSRALFVIVPIFVVGLVTHNVGRRAAVPHGPGGGVRWQSVGGRNADYARGTGSKG